MPITRFPLLCVLIAILVMGSAASAGMAVDDTIALSPNHYFAGIIDYSGIVQCELPPGKAEICWTTARVVEVFAAQTPDGSPFPKTIRFFGTGPAGRESKGIASVVAIPMREYAVFAAKIMEVLERPDSPTNLRALAKAAVAASKSR